MRQLLPLTLAALLTAPVSGAMATSEQSNPLDTLTQRYLEGYETRNGEQTRANIDEALEPLNPEPSVFWPTSNVSPIAMGILALEHVEGPRDRVRYHITYAMADMPNPQKYGTLPISFIQVDRYSMGATIRQDMIDAYGGEHVAPPEEFDVGPHVSWRLVTRPIQGTRALIIAAGRRELSDAQAQQTTCLTTPCLSYGMEQEGDHPPWSDVEEIPLALDVAYPTKRGGLLTPAAAIEQLTGGARYSAGEQSREAATPPTPFVEAVIEINLWQDTAMNATLRQGGLMDDSIAANWKQIFVMPSDEDIHTPSVNQAVAYECQRGPKFPEKGKFCP